MVSNDTLLAALGCATADNGCADVDVWGQTSVPSVWAAGNVADQRLQVLQAAAAGQTAALGINTALIAEETASAVEEYRRRGRR
jgi:thioredoxin reductase